LSVSPISDAYLAFDVGLLFFYYTDNFVHSYILRKCVSNQKMGRKIKFDLRHNVLIQKSILVYSLH